MSWLLWIVLLWTLWASLVPRMVKNLLAMRETWVQSLVQEDPLEKGMATHSSIFAWRIPWTREPGRQKFMGLQRVRHDWENVSVQFHEHCGCMHLFRLEFSLDICPGVGLLDHTATLFLAFWGTSILFSIVATPIYIPTNSVGGFPLLHALSRISHL